MRALQTADDDRAVVEVDVVPAQIAPFRHAQAMPVDHEPVQPIPATVSVGLQRVQEHRDFLFGQVLAGCGRPCSAGARW